MLVSIYAVGVAAGPQSQGALVARDEGQNQGKGDHCQNRDASDPSRG